MYRLHIMVMYISFDIYRILNNGLVYKFLWVLKNVISPQNLKVLAFSFIDKHMFMTNMDQKSIFYPCEVHILSLLDISILYINF
jgi:hypothetical protein